MWDFKYGYFESIKGDNKSKMADLTDSEMALATIGVSHFILVSSD
jgi:hypothetical protein